MLSFLNPFSPVLPPVRSTLSPYFYALLLYLPLPILPFLNLRSFILGLAPFNRLKTKLNPICHFPALLGVHHILHVGRIRVNWFHCIHFSLFLRKYYFLFIPTFPGNRPELRRGQRVKYSIYLYLRWIITFCTRN